MVGLNPDIAKIVVFKPLGSLAVSRDLGTGGMRKLAAGL